MTTRFFTATNTDPAGTKIEITAALVEGALVDSALHTSRKGLPINLMSHLKGSCARLALDETAQAHTTALNWTITRLDAAAKLATLNAELEAANARANELIRLFQISNTATDLLIACGKESAAMDLLRKEIAFLTNPTARA